MASRRPRPVALLRARYRLTRRQLAKILAIKVGEVRGIERWTHVPLAHLHLIERRIELHQQLAQGWFAAIDPSERCVEDARQLTLLDLPVKG